MVLVGCRIDNIYIPGPCWLTPGKNQCEIEPESEREFHETSTAAVHGKAVALLTHGLSYDESMSRYLIVGAPGEDDYRGLSSSPYSVEGEVRAIEVDVATGTMLTGMNVPILSAGPAASSPTSTRPASEDHWGYGTSLLATDVRDCHTTSTTSWTAHVACGEELLIGIPRITSEDITWANGFGQVMWREWSYAAEFGTYFPGDGGGWIVPAHPGGVFTTGLVPDFGYSLAAPRPEVLAFSPQDTGNTEPWGTAPDPIPWVAIGWPGLRTVWIYRADSASTEPFGPYVVHYHDYWCDPASGCHAARSTTEGHIPTQILGYPHGGKSTCSMNWCKDAMSADVEISHDVERYGHALAVGAPYDDSNANEDGRVFVYRGLGSSSGDVFSSQPLELTWNMAGVGSGGDRFGESLAAGRFWKHDRDALIVGAPGRQDASSTEVGGICQFRFVPDGPNRLAVQSFDCFENPYPPYPALDDFGASVAVGDFLPHDGHGVQNSPEGRRSEVAVGAPGRDTNKGMVSVFATDGDGVRIDERWSIYTDLGASPLGGPERFGAALATRHEQQTRWQDLAIGAPWRAVATGGGYSPGVLDGAVSLTRANTPPSSCTDTSGVWEAVDATSTPRMVRVWEDTNSGHVYLVFVDGYVLEMKDNYGAGSVSGCVGSYDDTADTAGPQTGGGVFTLTPGTYLELAKPWPCGTPETWTDVPADELINRTAGYYIASGEVMDVSAVRPSSGATDEWELHFDISKFPWNTIHTKTGISKDCRIAEPVHLINRSTPCED